jgi:uncharacterized protein YajQ (UPF0234 family)
LWQVLDSNQRRLQPTILQTAPFGRSGNLPCRLEFHPAAGRNNTQLHHYGRTTCTAGQVDSAQWLGRTTRNGAAKVAGESSFDIVSKVDRQEVDNALNQAAKEVRQRFDFKNTDASIRWSGPEVEMEANSEERVKAVLDVFQSKLVRRGVSLKALDAGDPRSSGKLYKITATTKEGISQENAKKVSKLIRDEGPKSVRAQVQGDELRVSSKSRDDLQKVQALIKAADLDFAVQFTNYR